MTTPIWSPHVTAAAVIHQDDKFLLVQERINNQLVLNQPAGHLENGESIIDAAIRETQEETTCTFTPDYLVGIYRWPVPNKTKTYLRFCFAGSVSAADNSKSLDNDIVQTLWLSEAQIRQRKAELRSPLVLDCLDDYLRGRRYPLDLLNEY